MESIGICSQHGTFPACLTSLAKLLLSQGQLCLGCIACQSFVFVKCWLLAHCLFRSSAFCVDGALQGRRDWLRVRSGNDSQRGAGSEFISLLLYDHMHSETRC